MPVGYSTVDEVRQTFECISTSVKNRSGNEPIILSFDISHAQGNDKAFRDVGVCLFDTRYLTKKVEEHTHPPFWTHTYVFALSPKLRKQRKRDKKKMVDKHTQRYTVKTSQFQQFGGAEQFVIGANRRTVLQHMFYHSHDIEHENSSITHNTCCFSKGFQPFERSVVPPQFTSSPASNGRPLIIVGHHVEGDLKSLYEADFNPEQAAPVISYIDTQALAKEFYSSGKQESLKDLSLRANLGDSGFHHSGNDATYTMLVLLDIVGSILGDENGQELNNLIHHVRRGKLNNSN